MGPSSHSTTTFGVFRVFLVDMLILGMILLVAEGLVRLVVPQETRRHLRNVFTGTDDGYRFTPGSSTIVNNGYGDHLFAVNSWGARDEEYGPRQQDEWRILSVGNSFNDNQAVDVDEIWSNVLESNLSAAYPDRVFSVVNAGQAGWGLWKYLHYLEEMLPIIEPDVVILSFPNTNGMLRKSNRPSPKPTTIWRGVPRARDTSFRYRAKFAGWYADKLLEDRSQLYVAFRRLTFYPGIWTGITLIPRLHPLYSDPQFAKRVIEPTTELLTRIKALCDEHQIQLVVLSIPWEEECNESAARLRTQLERPDVSNLDFGRPVRVLRGITEEIGIPMYDPIPALSGTPGRTYFRIFRHWNQLGNRVVATGLQEFLAEEGLLGVDEVLTNSGGPDDATSAQHVDP